MAIIKITGFTGEIPRLVPRLLPDSASTNAVNVRLESGGLSPYRKPQFIKRIEKLADGSDLPKGAEVQTIYQTNDGKWLAWLTPVYVAPGPVATDRLYIFGDGAPKMLTNDVYYPLKLESPKDPLTASLIVDNEVLNISGTDLPLTDDAGIKVGNVEFNVNLVGRKATITVTVMLPGNVPGTMTPAEAQTLLNSMQYKNSSNPASKSYKSIAIESITNDQTKTTTFFNAFSIVRTGGFDDESIKDGEPVVLEGNGTLGRPVLSITPLNPTWVNGSASGANVFSGATINPGSGAANISQIVFSIDGLTNGEVDSSISQTILYVYTYVTSFGEESAPSPVSNDLLWSSGLSVKLSGFEMPIDTTRSITTQRIYRSQTSLSGTDLYFIAERNVSASDFIDNIAQSQQNEPIPSLDWNTPPDDLNGLIPLPNGMMAAFTGKELYFCEPWRPHAWPEKYVLTMDYEIVALGAYGTTIVVATKGQPYIVAGASPDTMSQEKLELNLPCINARGLVDLGYAIAYPSHDGLVVASSSGARVVTDQLMTRDDWLRTAPERFVGGQFYGRYFASYEYVDPLQVTQSGSFIIDLTGQTPFLNRTNYRSTATWYDIAGGNLYLCLDKTDIYQWDSLDSQNEILTWRSKHFVIPQPTNFGVILIEASTILTPEEQAALDAARKAALDHNLGIFGNKSIGGEINGSAICIYPVNGDDLERVPDARFVTATVYADGEAVATVTRINRAARLPSGFLATVWEVEIHANADIAQVTLAGTGAELAGV
jgi:hypothetical protein